MKYNSSGFCSVDNLSVVIPYKDFESLVKVARNYDSLVAKIQRMEKQLDALRVMYGQALDRIADINRYL